MVISQSRAIKKKLMAATSMLLVACIMMISASYAWFTLSTAPEVTGITTTVGANGNLEIALANAASWKDVGKSITSNVGDSTKAIDQKNVTWGNLVDVSDSTYYGLNDIVLMPAALNYVQKDGNDDTTKVDLASILSTPSYGADGRVSELLKNTVATVYNNADRKFNVVDDTYGVRAIGTASAMTPRQTSYRNAKSAVANASSYAAVYAAQSLNDNGSDLANIIVQHATDASIKYGKTELDTITDVIVSLEKASESINTALTNAIVGMVASAAGEDTLSAELFSTFENEIKSGAYTVATDGTVTLTNTTLTTDVKTFSLGENFGTMFTKAKAIETAITKSEELNETLLTTVGDSTEKTITWEQIREVLEPLVNPDKVTINNIAAGVIKDNIQALIDDVLAGNGIKVQMPTGSGVYSDIADFCGDYSAQITLENVTYGSLTLKKTTATMTTVTTAKPSYFNAATSAITAAGAPSSKVASGTSVALTDTFGYALDLFFRTNVDNSSLKLQTDAVQRIYGESTNEATQGGGSNMTFTAATGFSVEDMKQLMGAIRVVFMDGNGTILGRAKLDMTEKQTSTTGEGENAVTTTTGGTTVVGSTVTSDLKLYEITKVKDEAGNETGQTTESFKSEQVIMDLSKNTPTAMTTLVYLDGELVTNSMVANGELSMTGSMNLQFSSTATLVPMENTSLLEGGEQSGTTTTQNPVETTAVNEE